MGYFVKLGMACGFWLSVLLASASGDPPASVEYLVLKNGSVLTGQVARDGTVYVLTNPGKSGESRYQAAMVARVCGSSREVYELLQKCSIPDDANDHCRLARFCLTHNLMKEARNEIDEAIKYDRRSTEAQILQKQWTAIQNGTTKPTEAVPSLPTPTIAALPTASVEDWPALLSPAGTQDFSRRIQPMLLAGCGTGACHGVPEGKRALVLKRGLPGAPPSAQVTRINLERVLGLINKETPEASELLKRAQQPHGHFKTWPVSTEQQTSLQQWINFAAGKQELPKHDTSVLQAGGTMNKEKNEFASSGGGTSNSPPSGGSKLPSIPGLSGAAQQQTGTGGSPRQPEPPTGNSTGNVPGGLPAIPGLSGQGQNGTKDKAPPPGDSAPGKPPGSAKVTEQAVWDYAKRLGLMPMLPAQTQPPPERLQIVNAGSYRIDIPPLPEVSEEVREKLKKEEAARKGDNKETAPPSPVFLRTGTVVNSRLP